MPRPSKILVALALTVGLLAGIGWSVTAQGSGSLAANTGVFSGTDANGNFQAALDAAVAAAETAAGCCDQRVSYTVVDTSGQRGGFIYLNDITVTIKASW